MKRRWSMIALLLFAVSILVSAPNVVPARAASSAVDVKPDYDKKTITITVRLAFYLPEVGGVPYSRPASVKAAVTAVEADIRKFWGKQKFLCFDIIIVLKLRVASGPDDVHDDEVAIRLDPALVPIKNSTSSAPANVAAGGPQNYLSEEPADAAQPATGPPRDTDGIVSVWPIGAGNGVYAHEFGHVLGLDDNYDGGDYSPVDGSYPPLPGAADDLMRLQGQAIDPTTVTRMIRRSGKVDESKMKCPISADLKSSDFGLRGWAGGALGLHMWACRTTPPSNAGPPPTPMVFDGTLDLKGEYNAGPFGSASGGGKVPVSTSLAPGDPFFTLSYSASGGSLDLSQAITWKTGRPQSTSVATLSMTVPLANPIVFSEAAKECK